MAAAIQELLVGQRVCVRWLDEAVREARQLSLVFVNVPEVLVDGFVCVSCSAALDCKIPERDVFKFSELLNWRTWRDAASL